MSADDVITRAKAALTALNSSMYGGSAEQGALRQIARENTFIRASRELMPELVAEIEKLRAALADLVDPDDCHFDHNGDCQAHGFFGGPCGHAVAKELLGGA